MVMMTGFFSLFQNWKISTEYIPYYAFWKAVFKGEGEERQSLISGLKRTLIKGRYLDQTEMAWNHFYYSGVQAVSLSAWNSTYLIDETYSLGVLSGCMTPRQVKYFAVSELDPYTGSNWI